MLPETPPIVTFRHSLRSRYGETDKMGYVYYGRYLEYFEVARTEMVRKTGYSYAKLEESGIMLPVIHSELKYHEPVFYDELMDIVVYVHEVPNVRLRTFYKVFTRGGERLNTTGMVTLCFMDQNTRRPVRAPAGFVENVMKLGNTYG